MSLADAVAHSRESLQTSRAATIIEALAQRNPDMPAIAVLGNSPLTYGRLFDQIITIGRRLNEAGVGRNDRVAIVLPSGAEMVTALLAVLSCATAAPLNPAYGAAEFKFYLDDLNVKALLVQSGLGSPAAAVARAKDVPVIELSANLEEEAGVFGRNGEGRKSPVNSDYDRADDIAIILHTSGTTSRPKIVPLTQANILFSADHIRTALELTERDRCLNVMPLFHIHGIMTALASLLAGGIVCPVRFEPHTFFHHVDELALTWYTAVPTVHQAILRLAGANRAVIERTRLRFIRSSSAALPIRVKADLEKTFNAPVIEAYGMTEAAHQVASNPLPPGERKPGSVGMAAGPRIAVMDEAGNLRPSGQAGEIVIQGPSLFQGYESNPEANADAFVKGWFRTGDQGYVDADGYLFLTGRLKDVINRGGEKISPQEVDEALLSHAAVEQAATFAVPHPSLGEDVVAAVVLRKDTSATEREIREFVSGRLAAFKVPRQVLILDEIPKGPSGKLQRRALAETLALLTPREARAEWVAPYIAPDQTVEHQLVQIWEEILGTRPIGLRDNFFEFGGDSLLAAEMVERVEQVCGEKVPLSTLLAGPTIEHLGKELVKGVRERDSLLVKIQSGGKKRPFFFLHGDHRGGGFYCLNLARGLGEDQPFCALRPLDRKGDPPTIEEMAAIYIKAVREVEPRGPYILGGLCHGGVVAFEMARQLKRQGEKVDLVVMIAPPLLTSPRMRFLRDMLSGIANFLRLGPDETVGLFLLLRDRWTRLRQLCRYSCKRLREVAKLPISAQGAWAFRVATRITGRVVGGFVPVGAQAQIAVSDERGVVPTVQSGERSNIYVRQIAKYGLIDMPVGRAMVRYSRRPYGGRVALFWPVELPVEMPSKPAAKWAEITDRSLGWSQVVSDLEIYELPGTRISSVTKEINILVDRLKPCLDKAQTNG